VTLMKAMAMGAVPITSRFADSTLPELTTVWDLGPQQPLALDLADPGGWAQEWAAAAVAASFAASRGELAEHRAAMKADARRRFSWAHVARLWDDQFMHEKGEREASQRK
jgi:hypothetical protein